VPYNLGTPLLEHNFHSVLFSWKNDVVQYDYLEFAGVYSYDTKPVVLNLWVVCLFSEGCESF